MLFLSGLFVLFFLLGEVLSLERLPNEPSASAIKIFFPAFHSFKFSVKKKRWQVNNFYKKYVIFLCFYCFIGHCVYKHKQNPYFLHDRNCKTYWNILWNSGEKLILCLHTNYSGDNGSWYVLILHLFSTYSLSFIAEENWAQLLALWV